MLKCTDMQDASRKLNHVATKEPAAQAQDVVLLGAGFSKAVSCQFPLIHELGKLALHKLDKAEVPRRERPDEGAGFEAWLSRIGEDQPYRSVEENLAARRLFVQISTAIAGVLSDRQRSALEELSPLWLDDLISVLHVRQATVISFNYDNVIECAVDGHCLMDRTAGGIGRAVTSHDIVDRLPPLPPSILSEELPIECTPGDQMKERPPSPRRDADQVARSLRLLKLHGSLSWYWSPDDETGVTLQRWRAPGTFGDPSLDDEEARRRKLPGRVPFIVPPTATKSSYLTNLVVREIWHRARAALAKANRLIVIGYSVPPEDQVASGMLADALRGRGVEVIIVDSCAAQVEDRLRHLGVGESGIQHFDGPSCVEDFAACYRDEQAAAVVKRLRDSAATEGFPRANTGAERSGHADLESGEGDLQGQVNIDWGYFPWGSIDREAMTVDGNDLLVPLAPEPTEPRNIDQTQTPTLLRHLSDHDKVRRLIVVDRSKKRFPVVDYTCQAQPQGTIDPLSWHLTLVPSGHARGQ